VAGLGLLGLAACSSEKVRLLEERVQELEQQRDETRAALTEVRSTFDSLESAADDLEVTVERFGHDSWRDVVGDVEASTAEVKDQVETLGNQLSEAEQAAER
jgi:prefoldin subunit 5